MADSSPYNTQTLQLQFLANIRVGKVVQRNPFTSAGRAFARRALIAVKGLPYVSNAAAVAEAGASHSGIYEKGKKENPDNPFNSKTVFDMSREVVVKGLGLATGTLGKRGTTFSIANNLYDVTNFCSRHDVGHFQIGLRTGGRANTYGLIGKTYVKTFLISSRIYCNSFNTHLFTSPNHSHGNLPTIGNQNLFKHW